MYTVFETRDGSTESSYKIHWHYFYWYVMVILMASSIHSALHLLIQKVRSACGILDVEDRYSWKKVGQGT